jgi:hypothetical protein
MARRKDHRKGNRGIELNWRSSVFRSSSSCLPGPHRTGRTVLHIAGHCGRLRACSAATGGALVRRPQAPDALEVLGCSRGVLVTLMELGDEVACNHQERWHRFGDQVAKRLGHGSRFRIHQPTGSHVRPDASSHQVLAFDRSCCPATASV